MIGPQGVTAIEAGMRMGSGMRVVLLHSEAEIRTKVHSAVDEAPCFVLVGESREWRECEALLDRFVPELLIASMGQVPPQFLEDLSASTFPVLVGLQGTDYRRGSDVGLFDALLVPPGPEHVRGLLERVRLEIYRRKADELSTLLERYMTCTTKGGEYLSKLRVEPEDQTQDIAVENVLFIAADGNYVRVHTNSKAYEIRETMTGISARLDPSRFARAHRSFIVNLSHVHDVVMKEGSAACVRLSNGMEVPVGPHYREGLEGMVRMRNRLTA